MLKTLNITTIIRDEILRNYHVIIQCNKNFGDIGLIFHGYGFLSFAKNIGKNIGKNKSKKLSGKYSPKLLDHAKKSATGAFKTTSKKNQKVSQKQQK